MVLQYYDNCVNSITLKNDTVIEAEMLDINYISDGYHTFSELYEFRLLLTACLFNEWVKAGIYDVHKSWKHPDGEYCFGGGWFIVKAHLPTGQISFHYEEKDWDKFNCQELDIPSDFDGHSAQDCVNRLKTFIKFISI
jgi:hypothetical protein